MAYSSRTEFFLICFLGVILIMVAMYFGTAPVTGASEHSKLAGEPYEGFTDAVAYFENRDNQLQGSPFEGFEDNKKEEFMKEIPRTKATQQLNATGKVSNTSGFTNMDTKAEAFKVEGFAGLQGGPIVEDSGMMSFLRDNEARTDCPGYGYTKSTGNVCMSQRDIYLMSTRGGNATGK